MPARSGSESAKYRFTATEVAVNDTLKGTLFLPGQVQNPPLVIMIAGSGPTDRNGNQARLKSNCSQYLAESLAKSGIAAYSYDKRILSPKYWNSR